MSSVCTFVCLSIDRSVHTSVYMSVCLSHLEAAQGNPNGAERIAVVGLRRECRPQRHERVIVPDTHHHEGSPVNAHPPLAALCERTLPVNAYNPLAALCGRTLPVNAYNPLAALCGRTLPVNARLARGSTERFAGPQQSLNKAVAPRARTGLGPWRPARSAEGPSLGAPRHRPPPTGTARCAPPGAYPPTTRTHARQRSVQT